MLPATPRCVNSVATSSPSDVDDHSVVHVEEAHDPLRLWLHKVSSRTCWSVHGAHNAHKVALETRSTNDKTILVKLQIPQSMEGAKDARTATMLVLVIANGESSDFGEKTAFKSIKVRGHTKVRLTSDQELAVFEILRYIKVRDEAMKR